MRLGLIAISGLRLYNDRLVEVGLTLPGFYERAKTIASMPSLGLLTLAAVVPDEYDVSYLEVPEHDLALLDSTDFDVVAISSFTAKSDVMYRVADYYRARGVRVVLGGLHCTLLPEEAAAHADAVVAGEGEVLFPRVLEDLRRERVTEKIYRNASTRDVDLACTPAPRYDLLDVELYNRIPVQTTRGCPLNCEFCAASKIFGGYKLKPLENVKRDIRAIKEFWPHPFIELADDNTFVNKKWARKLVRLLADEELHWFTETDISVADDPELLELLGSSGCRQVLIGLESPRARSLDGLEARNWKLKRLDEYRRAIDAIQSRGVSVNGCFIVGLDADTPDIFEEIEKFVKSSGLTEVQITVLTPFPNTPLYSRLRREGRLLRDRYWERCTLYDVNFLPKNMSVEQLEQGLEYLMANLYSRDEYRRRRRLYMQMMRTRRRTQRQEVAA